MTPAPARGGARLTIPAFSDALLDLARIARTAPPHRLLADALSRLRALVPFDAGWWGECSQPGGGAPAANWQHGSVGLPAAFASEWNAVGADDGFALGSMAAIGRVCRASGYDDDAPAVRAFARRHDLFHAMAVTFHLPGSGLLFFVSVYRGRGGHPFDDDEAALFGAYGQHLHLHWCTRLQDTLRRALSADARGTALCDRGGRLHYIGSALAAQVSAQHPGWQGTVLPAAVTARTARAPCQLRLGRRTVSVRSCGDLLALSFDAGDGGSGLSPRQREAALLYAGGASYKAIAQHLRLSPATVRTYLRDVYACLAVRNKQELAALLGADGPTAPGLPTP